MISKDLIDMIVDHYENPRNFGKMEDADVIQEGGNSGCGDTVVVYLKIDPINKNVIQAMSFEGEGCTVCQATTSILTDLIKGKTFEQVRKINSEKLKDIIGKDLVIKRPKCVQLGIDTVKVALKKFEKNNGIFDSDKKAV